MFDSCLTAHNILTILVIMTLGLGLLHEAIYVTLCVIGLVKEWKDRRDVERFWKR